MRANSIATAVLPTPVGPKIAITRMDALADAIGPVSADAGQELFDPCQRGRGRLEDLDRHGLPRRRGAFEVDGLTVADTASQPGRIGAARALYQNLHLAADEALATLMR